MPIRPQSSCQWWLSYYAGQRRWAGIHEASAYWKKSQYPFSQVFRVERMPMIKFIMNWVVYNWDLLPFEGEGGNLSTKMGCNESEVTYSLEGEGTGEFVSADAMQRIRGRLPAGTWQETGIHQSRWHQQNPRSLTNWNVKEQGTSSEQMAGEESEVTYSLDEGTGQLVSRDGMQRVRYHLLAGRRRDRGVRQPRWDAKNPRSLTNWEAKGEGI